MIRRKQPKPKGWFEAFIDDTNIIEKFIFLMWFCVIGAFYVMLDWFDIWIRVLLSVGLFTVLSILVYGFACFMSNQDRSWN